MYTDHDFESKVELKRALASGQLVRVYAPGLGEVPDDGVVYLEGPHYPRPHRWYAQGQMSAGRLVSVK